MAERQLLVDRLPHGRVVGQRHAPARSAVIQSAAISAFSGLKNDEL